MTRYLATLDGNGIQDPNEPGVAGVTVTLQDSNGNLVDSDTTDGQGIYGFDDVAPGNYKVTVTRPGGFTGFAPVNQGGNDDLDSDINPDGMSDVFSVAPNETKDDVDAGLIPETTPQLASLGDRVFIDGNSNGIQDSNESGLSGLPVTLLDANGNQVATTTTGNDGLYTFADLQTGDYQVRFAQPDTVVADLGGFTTANVGDDAFDSDANPSNGLTGIINLEAGGKRSYC